MNLRLVALTAGLTALAAPARADDVAAVTAKLGSAAAGVTSFVVQMHVVGATGVTGSLTFVRPMSMKSEFSVDQLSLVSFFIDGMAYVHAPGGGWQKMKIDPAHLPQQSVNVAESLKSAKVTLLPDRREDGVAVGVFEVEMQVPATAGLTAQAAAQQSVCAYDKTSYLLKNCTNSIMTMTYGSYNDPANTVVLPPEAKNAVLVIERTPPASSSSGASPAPAASSAP